MNSTDEHIIEFLLPMYENAMNNKTAGVYKEQWIKPVCEASEDIQ